MVSRLFGRAKKPAPQEPQPSICPFANETEDEGFTIVNSSPPSRSNTPIYPSLSGFPQPHAPQESGNPSQPSCHFLEGVPFVLSGQCYKGGNQMDETTARIEGLSERLKFVDWASMECDFRFEKAVLQDNEITDTLRRLQTK